MLEECNNKKDTINILTDSINQFKFTLKEVEYFINNYANIKYTSNNINKNCGFVFRFEIYSIDY